MVGTTGDAKSESIAGDLFFPWKVGPSAVSVLGSTVAKMVATLTGLATGVVLGGWNTTGVVANVLSPVGSTGSASLKSIAGDSFFPSKFGPSTIPV